MLVNFESSLLEYLKTNYSLKYDNKSKKVEISVKDVENELKINAFNLEPIQVKENGQTFELEKNNSFRFSPLMEEDESNIYINLMINKITYKLKLSEISNKPVPTSGNAIVKNIYDKQASMTLAGNKIIQMNNEYYPYAQFKKMLNIENELVLNGYMYGNSIEEEFFGNRLNVPLNIEEAYFNLLNEIKKLDTLPSLMCLSGPLKEAAKGYCELIETELDNLPDNEKIIDERIKNILYIGTIKDEKNNIYLTPLHPLILRYEIQKSEKINGEVLSEKILKKYNPSGLLPYWTEGNSFFFSNIIDEYPRGIMYKLYSAKNKMNSERASSIIKSRLTNFKSHFKYLFNISPDFSLNMRFLDIDDYQMILTVVC
ncbi:DNA-binding protein, partial [Staphylococcus condimenti]